MGFPSKSARARTRLTQRGVLCSPEHDRLENHLQPFHWSSASGRSPLLLPLLLTGNLGLSLLDKLGDTVTEIVPIVKRFGAEEAEQGIQLFDIVLDGRAEISAFNKATYPVKHHLNFERRATAALAALVLRFLMLCASSIVSSFPGQCVQSDDRPRSGSFTSGLSQRAEQPAPLT